MSSNYTVVLDANVLYPSPLRSFLMYLAATGEFRARWTDHIHDEWVRTALAKHPELDPAKLQRTRELMNLHVPGCLVTGYEPLIESIKLPDPDDRHVVAAAVKTRAEAIVTFNLKDFPTEALEPLDVMTIHPDDFIADLIGLNAAAVIEAAQRHRAEMTKPAYSVSEYLVLLQKQKLPETVSLLRQYERFL
jgi:predicted nucleic acid-binding protein